MSPEPVVFTVASPDPVGGRPADKWSSLDMPAIIKQLTASGVSAPDDQSGELTALVKEAKADGHDLFVLVTDQHFSPFTVYRDIAQELQQTTGGTVLVFGPGGMGTASTDFSRVELEDGTSEVHAGASAPQAAREIYEKAVDPNVNWTLVTIALIVVVVIGAVIARVRGRASVDDGTEPKPAADGTDVDNEATPAT
ncbi:DUF6676 family protein [Gordonia malaquae]|uniref:Rv1476 family membrane protein n=1 Tax=Gordonia malaquae TaxID=410332 RepID=UPI0030FE42DB